VQPVPQGETRNGNAPAELPSFLKDLGFEAPQDIDDNSVDEVIVPAARRSLAEQRQQTLSTMVLMGIKPRRRRRTARSSRKLMFHIDATESTAPEVRPDEDDSRETWPQTRRVEQDHGAGV